MVRLWAILGLVACGGGGDPGGTTAATAAGQKVPEVLLSGTWQVAFASPDAMARQSGHPGWQAYFNKNYASAIASFSTDKPLETSRMHAELSAIYRQAALMQANAIEQTYGDGQRREGDPVEALYLLGVSEWIQGKRESSLERIQSSDLKEIAAESLLSIMSSWTVSESASVEFLDLGESMPGSFPELPADPHYAFAEAITERVVEASEPALSLQLAAWHEKAANAAEPRSSAWLDPWRLPGEESGDGTGLESSSLFLSAWTADSDVEFVAALRHSDTVDWGLWASKSPLAAAIEPCLSESVDAECVVDQANSFQAQLMDAMRGSAGQDSADHSLLASFGKVGVLRAGLRAAAHLGDETSEGILRVSTLDASSGPLQDPLFLIEMAAWDSANRNANRAQDLLHTQRNNVPGVEAIRTTLNALTLRVSRDAGGGIPMH